MEMWMFLTTAVVFTITGWVFRIDHYNMKETKRITQQTIDTMIAMGFVKVELDENGETEMIPWPEEELLDDT